MLRGLPELRRAQVLNCPPNIATESEQRSCEGISGLCGTGPNGTSETNKKQRALRANNVALVRISSKAALYQPYTTYNIPYTLYHCIHIYTHHIRGPRLEDCSNSRHRGARSSPCRYWPRPSASSPGFWVWAEACVFRGPGGCF